MATSQLVVGNNVLSRNDGVNGDIIVDSNGNVNITPADRTVASAASITWNALRVPTATLTLTGTTQVTTAAGLRYVDIVAPTITDTSAVTVDQAASVYINAAPTAGGSVTITNGYALWVDAGAVRFDGGLVVNEDSNDADSRFETNGNANAVVLDAGVLGGVGQLSIGSAAQGTVTAFVVIDNPAVSAVANQNFFKLLVDNSAAATVPAGTAAVVASVAVEEPNITATGTVTAASTVYVLNAPTEATNNYALWVDDGVTRLDGRVTIGGAEANTAIVLLDSPAYTATANTNIARLNVENTAAVTVPAGTTAVAASVFVGEPNLTATGTVTTAASLYVEAAPTEGGDNYSFFVDAGASRLDGNVFFRSANMPVVKVTASSISTAGAVTYTIAQLLGGLVLRDPNGGNRSDVSPTAALMVAGIAGVAVDDTFEFTIVNTADAAETLTVTAGANVTLIPATIVLGQNESCKFIARFTNVTGASETVTIYAINADSLGA